MTALAEAIKKVATGPHLSKDLSVEEARLATTEILSGEADEVQAAIFFIAMRMKTETNEENLGILQALQAYTLQESADVEQLMTIADPFNGFNRHCPVMAFLPPVLTASGLPTVSQGVKEMGPKFGVTHSQVLSAAGVNVDLTVKEATQRINQSDLAWSYLDQEHASPAVFAQQELRTRIIKRPSLATLEKMVIPIKAKQNHLQIGFVHKAYPPVLAWLSQQIGLSSALIIRGIEGGVLPTLREHSNNHRAFPDKVEACELNPADFGIEQDTRGVLPNQETVTAAETVELALKAFNGQTGTTYDSLVYGAASALWHTGLQATKQQAADHVRDVINSGKAKAHFEQGVG
ncbi:glycosyl transferase [Methylophaga sp. 42_25_T18]|nr:glycosyl transferase [Methylophaga sp. 42_25_T18]